MIWLINSASSNNCKNPSSYTSLGAQTPISWLFAAHMQHHLEPPIDYHHLWLERDPGSEAFTLESQESSIPGTPRKCPIKNVKKKFDNKNNAKDRVNTVTKTLSERIQNKQWLQALEEASKAARMGWSSFTKGYFLNRITLVAVLLLINASVPPQNIDLECLIWLGCNNISITFVL